MNGSTYDVVAVTVVFLATISLGLYGVKFARTTGDLLVASRTVSPLLNASAIGGEYLSAASFLGVAGLIMVFGADMLWYPVGFVAGYAVLLLLVAAPLRRSGAYTVPDFAEIRLQSTTVRRLSSLLVVVISWLYLVPQLQGAGLTPGRHQLRSGSHLTFPVGALVPHLSRNPAATGDSWLEPLSGAGGREHPLYATYALVLATFLGTMGLPHVLVRFYTNPDGAAARRTTLRVLVLLGVFYLLPAWYGTLGRVYVPQLLTTGGADTVVLALPTAAVGGLAGQVLEAVLVAGAFAAFLSTSSGLLVTSAGVLSQDLLGGTVRGFRRAALVAGVVPLLLSLGATRLPVGVTVGLAFAFAASTFCPLLILGIWWRGLTAAGAAAGLLVGGGLAAAAIGATLVGVSAHGWTGALLAQPAVWTVPSAFAVMVAVSLLTRASAPLGVGRIMLTLHAPEALRS